MQIWSAGAFPKGFLTPPRDSPMSYPSRTIRFTVAIAAVAMSAHLAAAKDAYYDIPSDQIKLVEGRWPEQEMNSDWHSYTRLQATDPYVVLDTPGEAYLTGPASTGGQARSFGSAGDQNRAREDHLVLRVPEGKEIKGRLFVLKSDRSGLIALRFVVPSSASKPEAKEPFYYGKIAHYQRLLGRDISGGAWYRHQIRLAQTELKLPSLNVNATTPVGAFNARDDFASSYDLFTGGRAISENLQLDRAMPQRGANETAVKLDSIKGITINEIDWKPLLKDAKPELDPLATSLPADQHVVFFPTFQAALAVADETAQHDTPILQLAQPRAEDARVVERYQRQLGLPLSSVARLLGPTLVKSVALTGSDPSFPIGTDLAVLFETDQPAVLAKLLQGRIAMVAAEVKDAKPVQGTIDGLSYEGLVSPGRILSSYVARLERVVVHVPTQAAGRRAQRQDAAAGFAEGVRLLPHPIPTIRRRGIGFHLPERCHDPPMVRAAMADRRIPPRA